MISEPSKKITEDPDEDKSDLVKRECIHAESSQWLLSARY